MNVREIRRWARRILVPFLALVQAIEHPIWTLIAFAILVAIIALVDRSGDRDEASEREAGAQ